MTLVVKLILLCMMFFYLGCRAPGPAFICLVLIWNI